MTGERNKRRESDKGNSWKYIVANYTALPGLPLPRQ
nr:MAG TPA: hypothetical protein [Caudoviricetes sp.]